MSVQPRTYKSNVLPRGKACLTCRRRKMRCDGKRPACTQCVTGRRENGCKFDEPRVRSPTQLLSDHVLALEQRLQRLQYSDQASSSESAAPPDAFVIPITESQDLLSAQPDTHLLGADLWCSSQLASDQTLDWINLEASVSVLPQVPPINPFPMQLGYIPSETAISSFVSTFLENQGSLGYLNLVIDVTSNYNPIKPPVFNAAALWGYHLQGGTDTPLKKALLSQALDEIMSSLAKSELQHETIVATSLVALHLFSSGRLLEAKYHADAAVSLSIASGLHQLPSSVGENCQVSTNGPSWADRQRAFWNTFELGCWSIITGTHNPLLPQGGVKTNISTPWITEIESLYTSPESLTTCDDLLDQDAPMNQQESYLSIRAKSVALLQMSGQLSILLEEEPFNPTHNLQQSRLEICTHKSSVCLGALFPLPIIATAPESNRFYNLVLAHCMLGAAMVLLHHPLAERQPSSMSKCQTWARKVLHTAQLVNEMEYSKLPPVIAICWAVAADVLLQELGSDDAKDPMQRIHIEEELNTLLRALEVLSNTYPIAGVLRGRVGSRYFTDQFNLSIMTPPPYLTPSPTNSQYSC